MISVKDTINRLNLISKGDIIGCAVSGGSDSMALLHFLMSFRKSIDFKLVCINVEHGIRGKESVADSDFVKDFCNRENLEFLFSKVDAVKNANEKNCNLEQSARDLRYNFFYDIINKGVCNKIFVAHNNKDNIETIFLNILRGSGTNGLCGMDVDNKKGIIRPMLYTKKEEILDYIKTNNINYKTDSTNKDNSYSRNYLRNCVFPLLEDKYNGFYENIGRLSAIVREEKEYLDQKSREYVFFTDEGCYIKLPCDTVLLKHAVFICCKETGLEQDILSVNINDIISLVFKQNGSFITLGGKLRVYKEYDKLYFKKENENHNEDNIVLPFNIGTFIIGGYEITVNKKDNILLKNITGDKENFYIDKNKIASGSVFRFRQKGDSFKRYKGGRKSLSDYFTDIKVPKRLRDGIPLLCNGSNVLIAFGFDLSDDVKIEENTSEIYNIFYRRIK